MTLRLLLVPLAVLLLLPLAPAAPAAAVPFEERVFGPQIEGYARYEGQTRCLRTEQPGVVAFRALLQEAYGANGGGILRGCSVGGRSEHKEGRAYDWMLNAHDAADRAKADEFLSWLLATDEHGNAHAMARRMGVMYIIWNGRSWSAWRAGDGWRRYTGRDPHTDHIHFSFSWAGARGTTSFWTTPVEPPRPPGPFDDVPGDHRFVDAIEWAVGAGLASGRDDDRFLPEQPLSRSQAVSLAWRMVDSPLSSARAGAADVGDGVWYAAALDWAFGQGYVELTDDGRFRPHEPMTRLELARLLHGLAGRPGVGTDAGFVDVPDTPTDQQAVAWLSTLGITQGVSAERFGSSDPVTRGQSMMLLYRLVTTDEAWSQARWQPSQALAG